MPPEIRYARSGDVSIASTVHGEGPIDLVFVHGAISHLEIELEVELEQPEYRALLDRFARYARVITLYDPVVRGTWAPDCFRGTEMDTAGDGFFATFDGPIRAIRCAQAIAPTVGELGLALRAGLHTGECERVGEKHALA